MTATSQAAAPPQLQPTTGGQYDPDAYDICRPAAPPPANETEAEQIARMQREFEALRDCVNAELKVRTESSLLTLIIFKVLLPFAAIAAGLTAIYIGILRAGEAQTSHAELFLGIAYLVIAAGAIGLYRSVRKPGSGGRGDSINRSVRSALNLTVPPSKERLTRNKLVNRWIFFWLTWGLILGLPLIFFLFRADVLERAGLKLIFDTANVCTPTVGGFNPYEGSDVCDDSGYTYTSSESANTTAGTGIGEETGVESLNIVPPRSVEEVNAAEIRLDVTTTLVLYFVILVGGILVNMVRWWRRDKKRKIQIEQTAQMDAARGTV
jgi:hypothetical protein